MHRGRTDRLPEFPLVTSSIRPFLLDPEASEGGTARREASAIGRPLRRGTAIREDGCSAEPSAQDRPKESQPFSQRDAGSGKGL